MANLQRLGALSVVIALALSSLLAAAPAAPEESQASRLEVIYYYLPG
jgi:hypothetical protein